MTKMRTTAWLVAMLLPLTACGQTEVKNAQKTQAETAQAAPADAQKAITAKLEKSYAAQGLKVASVRETPFKGLFEVVVSGNQVVYTDAAGDFMLVGDLVDVNQQKSLTAERMEELNQIDYAALPFDKAIKEVRGNGKLKVAVFSDPDCPFCKRLEAEFAKMTDITIYNFMMPIPSLHPNAQSKAVQIWCQPNRTEAWTKWMRQGQLPAQAANCPNPVQETMMLGERFGFNGTPTIVMPNGKVVQGFMPNPQLTQVITENQK